MIRLFGVFVAVIYVWLFGYAVLVGCVVFHGVCVFISMRYFDVHLVVLGLVSLGGLGLRFGGLGFICVGLIPFGVVLLLW